jgi:hypothetical protein
MAANKADGAGNHQFSSDDLNHGLGMRPQRWLVSTRPKRVSLRSPDLTKQEVISTLPSGPQRVWVVRSVSESTMWWLKKASNVTEARCASMASRTSLRETCPTSGSSSEAR